MLHHHHHVSPMMKQTSPPEPSSPTGKKQKTTWPRASSVLRARAADKTRLHRIPSGAAAEPLRCCSGRRNGGPGRRSPLRARKRLSGFTFCQVPVQRDIVCFPSSPRFFFFRRRERLAGSGPCSRDLKRLGVGL